MVFKLKNMNIPSIVWFLIVAFFAMLVFLIIKVIVFYYSYHLYYEKLPFDITKNMTGIFIRVEYKGQDVVRSSATCKQEDYESTKEKLLAATNEWIELEKKKQKLIKTRNWLLNKLKRKS